MVDTLDPRYGPGYKAPHDDNRVYSNCNRISGGIEGQKQALGAFFIKKMSTSQKTDRQQKSYAI